MATTITDVHIEIPSLGEVLEVLSFSAGFNAAVVVAGTTFLGIAAGIIGTFALLRKRALISDAISHCGLPGIALTFIALSLWGFEAKHFGALLLGGALSGLLGVAVIQFLTSLTRLKEDTAIAAVLGVFFGFGIVLLSVIQSLNTGSEGGLHHFIYGQTAAMRQSDAVITSILALVSLAGALALFKEFRLVCFDAEFAFSQGWPVLRIDALMMLLVVLVTVIGFQSVGLLLVIALLIIPPVAARFWAERLTHVTVISGAIGGLSGYLGSTASSLIPRMPAGAVIVLTAGILFLISFLFAPKRGIVAAAARILLLRLKIARDHLLRESFEVLESAGKEPAAGVPVALSSLMIVQTWPKWLTPFLLRYFSSAGLVAKSNGKSISLTEAGLEAAHRCTRNHRLWEEYLISYSDMAAAHVDYSADYVEHVLNAELISVLEDRLQAKGLLISGQPLPKSVHPTGDSEQTSGGVHS